MERQEGLYRKLWREKGKGKERGRGGGGAYRGGRGGGRGLKIGNKQLEASIHRCIYTCRAPSGQ